MSSFCKSYSHFFSKKFQHICISLDVNFNELLTNDVISFEQLGPDLFTYILHIATDKKNVQIVFFSPQIYIVGNH